VWGGEWGHSRDGCIKWGGYHHRGRGSFGGEFVHPVVTNGDILFCSYARAMHSSQITLGRTCFDYSNA